MAKPKAAAPPKRRTDRKSWYKSASDYFVDFYNRGRQLLIDLLINPEYVWPTGCLLLLAEIVLCIFIVQRVPCKLLLRLFHNQILLIVLISVVADVLKRFSDTEIDWSTYMQQVELVLNGTRSYPLISGDTGPLP